MRRRELLVAGAALLAAPATARAAAGDPARVQALRRAELDAALAYEAAGAPRRLARAARDHAAALATLLGALVAPVPPEPRRLEDLRPPVAGLAPALAAARSPRERARAAARIERALREGCAEQLALLRVPDVVRTVGTVYASHAAQAALLQMSAGLDPL
jgi:hypothetical protein